MFANIFLSSDLARAVCESRQVQVRVSGDSVLPATNVMNNLIFNLRQHPLLVNVNVVREICCRKCLLSNQNDIFQLFSLDKDAADHAFCDSAETSSFFFRDLPEAYFPKHSFRSNQKIIHASIQMRTCSGSPIHI